MTEKVSCHPDRRRLWTGKFAAPYCLMILILSGCTTAHYEQPGLTTSNTACPAETNRAPLTPVALVSYRGDDAASVADNSSIIDSAARDDHPSADNSDDDGHAKPTFVSAESALTLPLPGPPDTVTESLPELEATALVRNPQLRRLAQEAEAARAKIDYVDGLPDPTIGTNVFVAPIETAAGSQRANLTFAQMLPWLSRLDAQVQQACFEAMALQQVHAAQRLKVVGDVRALWYRLYVIGRQIEITTANQQLLEGLIDVANARVSTGKATQGDVLAGTLEYSRLEEQLVTLRQQQVSAIAEINQLLGRPADVPLISPTQLHVTLPAWDHSSLRQLATQHQPDIQTARIRTQATRWGLEVARLKRRPDFSVNASWFTIDNNRPPSTVVDVGDDAWSLGASLSIPLWDRKYDALEREARWKHAASHASVEESIQRYDALLRDLWEQARAADETATLYQQTILPQARQTLEADQESYINGSVDFDRIITDVRNVLTLELGYHRALGQLATALARIDQATGLSTNGNSGSQQLDEDSTRVSDYSESL